ncbi:MAG: Uma2 family endonuclease [Myxococcaceae bacterium]
MDTTDRAEDASPRESVDQRVVLSRVPWKQYEALLRTRGESSGVRMAYLDGELELMTPSWDHGVIKKRIARLLETWAEERDVPLTGAGSWTVKSKKNKAGVEADECYVLGSRRTKVPDLSIEVVWSGGGIEKLEVYRALGIREVWFWVNGAIEVYVLGRKGYERRSGSRLLPELDVALLSMFAREPDQTRAVRAFRAALRRN